MTCRHVLEHIADPVHFLVKLREHPGVGPETVVYVEVPNALYTLRDLGIWDLIYEHVSYFTSQSLRIALGKAGFELLDLGEFFGGQYIFAEARPRSEPVQIEANHEIEVLVREFGHAYTRKASFWEGHLQMLDPTRTILWGAGSKGVTFVNVLQQGGAISAIVDINPFKQGRFVPRTGTPVIAPEAVRQRDVASIIVINPLYRDEVAKASASLGLLADIVVA